MRKKILPEISHSFPHLKNIWNTLKKNFTNINNDLIFNNFIMHLLLFMQTSLTFLKLVCLINILLAFKKKIKILYLVLNWWSPRLSGDLIYLIYIYIYIYIKSSPKDIFTLILESEGGREAEKHQRGRETLICCLPCAPDQGLNLQHLRCTGCRSRQPSHLAGA